MTEKEFSKLTRHELLELLLMQTREQEQTEERKAEMAQQIHKLEESLEARDVQIHKLEQNLDARDERIHKLEQSLEASDGQIEEWKEQLYSKDNKIRELEDTLEHERALNKIQIQESGTIAEATDKLKEVLEKVQKAADRYIEKTTLCGQEEKEKPQEEKKQEEKKQEVNHHKTGYEEKSVRKGLEILKMKVPDKWRDLARIAGKKER